MYFQLIKWVSTKDDDDSEKAKEENLKNYSRLMNQIANAEWIEHKTKLVQEMNNVEAQNYEQLYDQIKVHTSFILDFYMKFIFYCSLS